MGGFLSTPAIRDGQAVAEDQNDVPQPDVASNELTANATTDDMEEEPEPPGARGAPPAYNSWNPSSSSATPPLQEIDAEANAPPPSAIISLPQAATHNSNPAGGNFAAQVERDTKEMQKAAKRFADYANLLHKVHHSLNASATPASSGADFSRTQSWKAIYDHAIKRLIDEYNKNMGVIQSRAFLLTALSLMSIRLDSLCDQLVGLAFDYLSGACALQWGVHVQSDNFWNNIRCLRQSAQEARVLYGSQRAEQFAFPDFVMELALKGLCYINDPDLSVQVFEEEMHILGIRNPDPIYWRYRSFKELATEVNGETDSPSPFCLLYCLLLWWHLEDSRNRSDALSYILALNESAMIFQLALNKNTPPQFFGGNLSSAAKKNFSRLVCKTAGQSPDVNSATRLFPELMSLLDMFENGQQLFVRRGQDALDVLKIYAVDFDKKMAPPLKEVGYMGNTAFTREWINRCVSLSDLD